MRGFLRTDYQPYHCVNVSIDEQSRVHKTVSPKGRSVESSASRAGNKPRTQYASNGRRKSILGLGATRTSEQREKASEAKKTKKGSHNFRPHRNQFRSNLDLFGEENGEYEDEDEDEEEEGVVASMTGGNDDYSDDASSSRRYRPNTKVQIITKSAQNPFLSDEGKHEDSRGGGGEGGTHNPFLSNGRTRDDSGRLSDFPPQFSEQHYLHQQHLSNGSSPSSSPLHRSNSMPHATSSPITSAKGGGFARRSKR
eukprot:jgi/Bigna1/84655/fgenesh1_pg.194_\